MSAYEKPPLKNTKESYDETDDKSLKIIIPKQYVLEFSDPRFTFKNFYIEYGRFHSD